MTFKDLPLKPSDQMLRQFAVLWLFFFLILAAWQLWAGREAAAYVLGILAVTIGPAGVLLPWIIKPIFIGWMILVFPIGWAISKVLLGFLFFCMFTPLAVGFRLFGRDALRLKVPAGVESYFQSKPMRTDLRSYFRQF